MYEFSSKSQLMVKQEVVVVVVGDTANVRVFKQITTGIGDAASSLGCWRYCKCTSFQANHNGLVDVQKYSVVVGDTANVRVFKQITTCFGVILFHPSCWRYCKCTSFQANHNARDMDVLQALLLAILQMYEFSSKSQPYRTYTC